MTIKHIQSHEVIKAPQSSSKTSESDSAEVIKWNNLRMNELNSFLLEGKRIQLHQLLVPPEFHCVFLNQASVSTLESRLKLTDVKLVAKNYL